MNDILAPLYELFFNWDVYQLLLSIVYDNSGYEKISWFLVVVPIALYVFYRHWDPIQKPKLKWFIYLILVSIIIYVSTSWILYSDTDIKNYIGNYSPDADKVNPDYFIFKMSIVSFLLSFVLSILLSIFPFRLLSSSNRHNPF